MGNKASPKLIGAFVVGAITLLVAGIMVFGSGQFLKRKLDYVFYFDGSVNGLNKGAPVKFRGVKIGQVTDVFVELNYTKTTIKTPVYAEIEPDRVVPVEVKGFKGKVGSGEITQSLIEKGLRAQLQVDSFVTGQLYIELDMHPDTPVRMVAKDSKFIEIPTIPSTVQQVISTLKDIPLKQIFNKLASALDGIERLINSPELMGTMSAAHDAAREVKRLVLHLEALIRPLEHSVESTLMATREGLKKADEVGDAITKALSSVGRDVKSAVKRLEGTLRATKSLMSRADGTLSSYQDLVAEGSKTRYDFDSLLVELKGAARSVRILADYLERNPQSLLRGKSEGDGR